MAGARGTPAPPASAAPDGSAAPPSEAAAARLLGVDPATERTEHSVALGIGATVLLYTGGLVERRGQHLDEGIGRLRDLLAELAGRPLPALCDELVARMGDGDDDIALLAVRLQERARTVAGLAPA